MEKIYQNDVIKKADEIIGFLVESDFFKEFQLKDTVYAKRYFCDVLTDKLIEGRLDVDFDEMFTELEFDECLTTIITGTYLNEMKEKGIIDSYEDENTEEKFFVTEKGTKLINDLKKDNLI